LVASPPFGRWPRAYKASSRVRTEIHAWLAGQVTEVFSPPTNLAHAAAGGDPGAYLEDYHTRSINIGRFFEHSMGLQNCRDLRRS
jgi:hypothetical protein